MVFGWFSEKTENDKQVVYAPSGLSMPQKATLIGGSVLGMLGISYILNYLLYITLGGVCAGVMFYDNEKLVEFINERKFLSNDLIKKFNENTAMIATYLTPAQITQGVGEGAGAVGRFGWLAQLGLAGSENVKKGGLDGVADNMAVLKKAM